MSDNQPGQPVNGFYDPHIHGQAGTMPGGQAGNNAPAGSGQGAGQGSAQAAVQAGGQAQASAQAPQGGQTPPGQGSGQAAAGRMANGQNAGAPAGAAGQIQSGQAGLIGQGGGQVGGQGNGRDAGQSLSGSQGERASGQAAVQAGGQAQANAQAPQGGQTPPGQGAAGPAGADVEDRPITDFARVDLQLGGAEVNRDLLAGFGRAATEAGLTPRQARALAQWHLRGVAEAREAALAEQSRQLAASWGKDLEANIRQVNSLCSRLDRMPGLERFSAELARSGAADNAVVVRGLRELAVMLGEDSAGAASGSGQRRTETAYEGICDAFARARSGNNHIIQ